MAQSLGPSDIDKTTELRTEILQLREQLKEEAQKPNKQVFDLQKEKLEQNIELQKMRQNVAELQANLNVTTEQLDFNVGENRRLRK